MRTLVIIFFGSLFTVVKGQNLEHVQLPNIYNAANTLENDQQFEFESLTKYSPNYYQLFGVHYRAVQGLGFNYKYGNWTLGITGLYSFGSIGMETMPLVFTTNYSFDFNKAKLVVGASLKTTLGVKIQNSLTWPQELNLAKADLVFTFLTCWFIIREILIIL